MLPACCDVVLYLLWAHILPLFLNLSDEMLLIYLLLRRSLEKLVKNLALNAVVQVQVEEVAKA